MLLPHKVELPFYSCAPRLGLLPAMSSGEGQSLDGPSAAWIHDAMGHRLQQPDLCLLS